jgi:hypothetical protein
MYSGKIAVPPGGGGIVHYAASKNKYSSTNFNILIIGLSVISFLK